MGSHSPFLQEEEEEADEEEGDIDENDENENDKREEESSNNYPGESRANRNNQLSSGRDPTLPPLPQFPDISEAGKKGVEVLHVFSSAWMRCILF